MVNCDLADVCGQGCPSSLTDMCPHWKLGSLSVETNILLSGECGITTGDRVMLWTSHCNEGCPLPQALGPPPWV